MKVRDKGEHREDQTVAQGRDKVHQKVEGCKTESSISVFLMEEKEEKQKMREADRVQCFALFLQGTWGRDKESIFRQAFERHSGDEEWRGAQGLLKN